MTTNGIEIVTETKVPRVRNVFRNVVGLARKALYLEIRTSAMPYAVSFPHTHTLYSMPVLLDVSYDAIPYYYMHHERIRDTQKKQNIHLAT